MLIIKKINDNANCQQQPFETTMKNDLLFEVIVFTVVLKAVHNVWLLIIMLVMYVAFYLSLWQMQYVCLAGTKRW